MIVTVLIALGLSIALYVLLAGADFGAGIVESFIKDEHSKEYHVVSHAIVPVWEANHIWSILAIVILFFAFPSVFAEISISFHVPLLIMLVGITLRGSAFIFRHYDTNASESTTYYSLAYRCGSWLSPFAQGVVAGGCLLGRVNPAATDFYSRFINPWCNAFSFSIGLFFCAVCALLASTYLIGETSSEILRDRFRNRARKMMWITLLSGSLVFIAAEISGLKLFLMFATHPVGVLSFLVALLLAIISTGFTLNPLASRLVAVGFTSSIVAGWFALQYPDLLVTSETSVLTFDIYESAAPSAALRSLIVALAVGMVLILPALVFLFSTFKVPKPERS